MTTAINKLCAQCIHDCKQPTSVTLINCPKFVGRATVQPQPGKARRRRRIKI